VAETTTVDENAALPAVAEITSSARLRRWLLLTLRIMVILAIVGFMAYGLVSKWAEVRGTWLGLAWQSVVLSVVAALAGMGANTMAWRAATFFCRSSNFWSWATLLWSPELRLWAAPSCPST